LGITLVAVVTAAIVGFFLHTDGVCLAVDVNAHQ